ncbi:MAG: hypothetical protein JNL09_06920 [Anaerolineales bacterium]|nr:hypothetical protein [Anaerolineales bacterium]
MHLRINSIWSPDLRHPSDGLPEDLSHFNLFFQVALSEQGEAGHEVFEFTVCSPSALSEIESGRFISNVLVLKTFEWDALHQRVQKLLLHCSSCKNWADVIEKLSGSLKHTDS